MGKEKLYQAAQAAGFAMVNPEDCDVVGRETDTDPAYARRQTTTQPAPARPAPKLNFSLDWFGFLTSRPAG
jgi:hypothetical protein